MDIKLETKEDVLAFIREDQDAPLAAHIDIAVMTGQYTVTWNEDEDMWEIRGDYHTLAFVSQTEGVIVSDALLTKVYG